ncbi:uncharacterized protein LOC107796620 [Nicotiana tabacum]|uniref:Uncharacterized protein LOC107796620 n=2 Tax=Nicotiana TaxID=4085 RepID=A0A1S4AE00_TOBAC|nr:PREDICTED: uncharacterized protein LOC104223667 [Nicotiana sylvestris]XP_016474902.1 PREDICTED: uncharacterized protein LOC107796620 [Nicotiana tabacum]
MYQLLCSMFVKVPWRKLTCNNYASPKWIFILNLAAWGRLNTKDRLAKWGIVSEQKCILCKEQNEIITHLFFECKISTELWGKMLLWQGIRISVMTWKEELHWAVSKMKGENVSAEIYRMAFAGCVYYIWQERNLRVFQSNQRSVGMITR